MSRSNTAGNNGNPSIPAARRAAVRCYGLGICLLLASAAIAADPELFDTPEAAVKSLMEAAQSGERSALTRILGSELSELLSGDDVQDKADLQRFAARVAVHQLEKNEDGSMTLRIGGRGHPFAIPLTPKDGKWFFNTAAGKEEILNRRIGENELGAIAVCRAYVAAQREYFQQDRDGDDVLAYAQRVASTAGKKDGLYWETAEDEPPSPLGALVAEAQAEGYEKRDPAAGDSAPRPYRGYLYRILTRQGANAPGGKFDYIINNNMVAGFALIAWPVQYGKSGVMTFLVNSNGKVLEKDFGEKTSALAAAVSDYDPDGSWKPTSD